MKKCVCGRTKIMWNTHRVGVTADNIVRYTASSLTVLRHSLICYFNVFNLNSPAERFTKVPTFTKGYDERQLSCNYSICFSFV